MSQPMFEGLCVDFESFLAKPSLKYMLKTALEQSKTKLAKERTDPVHVEEYEDPQECPLYFGLAFEWIAFHFLQHYGSKWNITSPVMTMSIGSTEKDVGIDGVAVTPSIVKRYRGEAPPVANSPVYIQAKATMNAAKVYTPNDGSRLGNFFSTAQCRANRERKAQSARYLVIHTGKGLSYHFDDYADRKIQIGYKDITDLMDGDYGFINIMRASVGLQSITQPEGPVDEPDDYS